MRKKQKTRHTHHNPSFGPTTATRLGARDDPGALDI